MSKDNSWEDKMREVSAKHPKIMNVDWDKLFNTDPAILGDMINDLIRVAHSEKNPGRRGKRSNVERSAAVESLSKLQGVDYSYEEFIPTLVKLKGKRSIRGFAKDVGLSQSKVQRILDGSSAADLTVMNTIAVAHDKDPSYFLEFRVSFINEYIAATMKSYPESSVVQYRRLIS